MWVILTLFWALLGIILSRIDFSIGIRDNTWSWKRAFLHATSTSAYITALISFDNDTKVLEQLMFFVGFGLIGIPPCAYILKGFLPKKK